MKRFLFQISQDVVIRMPINPQNLDHLIEILKTIKEDVK